jgi:pilus assembly protein Flp/PilA
MTHRIWKKFIQLSIWKDQNGQDMVEYALMAGFITVAAGAAFPPVGDQISTIFSRLNSCLEAAV